MWSRCCMTWMRPMTAPMMPMVGEKPPADSKTAGMRASLSLTLSIWNSMMRRSSEGSVPSTASMRAWRRKGSATRGRSGSSETMPWRRALLAKETIWARRATPLLSRWRKSRARRRAAAKTVASGNWSITAPRVPPKTIMAAVGWSTWLRCPPSRSRPARMPASARKIPPRLPASIELFLGVGGEGGEAGVLFRDGCDGEGRGPGEGLQISGGFAVDVGAVGDGAIDDVFAALEDDDFFAIDEGEHGIGRGFGVLDEVAVDDQRIPVEPGEVNHGGAAPWPVVGYPRGGGGGGRGGGGGGGGGGAGGA